VKEFLKEFIKSLNFWEITLEFEIFHLQFISP